VARVSLESGHFRRLNRSLSLALDAESSALTMASCSYDPGQYFFAMAMRQLLFGSSGLHEVHA
jgi:hypothetical protein